MSLPGGWLAEPAEQNFKLSTINEQQTVSFKITPQKDAKNGPYDGFR